jgi:DNA-binding NtrC family response regulator
MGVLPFVNTPNEKRGTVLLVDDDVEVRQIAAVILAEMGFQVVEAGNAEDAMEIIRGPTKIELLMTDLAMPGIGGMELARLAKNTRPELKLLYTSAYVRVAEGSKALAHGPLIEKPWMQEQLKEFIERLIGPGKPRN